MNKISPSTEEKLLDYLDGRLSSEEVKKLEALLQEQSELKTRLESLRSLQGMLKGVKMEQPSRNFTQQVMSKLDQYPLRSSLSIRNGIFLLVGVLVAALLSAFLVSSGVFDSATTVIDLNSVKTPVEITKEPLPSFRFDGKWVVNAIVVLNLVLAWLVLDRAILKPYFKQRMLAGH
jgi:hypothetical protein